MKIATKRASVAACVVSWLMLPGSGLATQHHHGGHHWHHHGSLPPYDTASEATLEGSIEELVYIERPGCPDCDGGAHVYLDGHDAEIHLCPSSFLTSHGCHLKEGQKLSVTGSKLTLRGFTVLLARELQCGGKTIGLRDESGRPLWRSRR